MVSIQGMPPAITPNTQSVKQQKSVVPIATDRPLNTEATKVATAVVRGIESGTRHDLTLSEKEHAQAHIQYDLPEGKSRQALEQYMNVFHQEKRDELSRLMGVDIYT
ncbi:chromosome partitioning protein ParA [Aliivibrio kagoshimensis]|jgi:hypothetical protein|uniref:chromosome partitioning protein ParA n=1 Tax=Aliivibrio kagoshimensis TaxID=2910230 RepID=UPI003D0B11B4